MSEKWKKHISCGLSLLTALSRRSPIPWLVWVAVALQFIWDLVEPRL